MHYNLALIGFGNVARSLARLLLRKRDLLESQYEITFRSPVYLRDDMGLP